MGKDSNIAWTKHTLNVVWGCVKVNELCANCYAERDSTRYGYDLWEANKDRRTFGEKYWNQPLKWNAEAEEQRVRARVFCSSMADVFEDHPTVAQERLKLWPLIDKTPWLDWQLLTKRPQNMIKFAPPEWAKKWPANVWGGTSAGTQKSAEEFVPELLKVPVAVKFVSAEPLLERVYFDLPRCEIHNRDELGGTPGDEFCNACAEDGGSGELCYGMWLNPLNGGISCVIVGGESGPGARRTDPEWIRTIHRECESTGTPFFFKQAGVVLAKEWRCKDRTGSDSAEWPPEFQVQQLPEPVEAA